MNITLVSVTERTFEVDQKAVGAKRRQILLQFLIESAILCGLASLACWLPGRDNVNYRAGTVTMTITIAS
jgi:putative ABC transport system permease protein